MQQQCRRCSVSLPQQLFKPHLTRLKKSIEIKQNETISLLSWVVTDFVLLLSSTTARGVVYAEIKRWPLI
ncbi:MAG: hypothetical protein OEY36_07025 [Gammaproteobacteria bacterium]|nr:hypothetical protein [Gammaproteobacteria bacterium]